MNRKRCCWILASLLLYTGQLLMAQVDTIKFKSGDFIVGEIKSMNKGILVAETEYSDSDFKIEWDKVARIYSRSQFMVTLSNGTKHYGRLHSVSDSTIQIFTINIEPVECDIMDIVYLNAYNDKFSDRFSATISLGFDLAKARTLRSLTTRSSLGYHAEKWSTDVSFNTLRSTQDSVADIQRIDADLNFRYVLPRRLYAVTTVSALSNTELQLDMRMNAQLGLGTFLLRSNAMYWGAKIGGNRNIERYSNETEDRETWEGYFGTELNLFDVGDLDLYLLLMAYPGFTEKGRWRSDSKLDIKYELPYDFYIHMGISFNYDNRPADDANRIDYVFQTGFGWEW